MLLGFHHFRFRSAIALCALLFIVFAKLQAQGPYELRGVWVATAFGIDWPKSTRSDLQKASLDSLFLSLQERRFNAVFFQVRVRADLLYPSTKEPFHEYVTGSSATAPDYDPVAYAIESAARHGLQFHAWFNTLILRGKTATKRNSIPASLWEQHPEWIDPRAHEHPEWKDVWLNPTTPEVRAYLKALIADFARRYDVDGIQLDDYLRYPSTDFPDSADYIRHNPGRLSREDWRREVITSIVSEIADTLKTIKPYIRFGVTPIGVYKKVDKEPAMESYSEVYQDSRAWLRRRLCDYLAPQLYFHIGPTTAEERSRKQFNPAFERLVADWVLHRHYRHFYAGIGTYKPSVKAEWKQQIDVVRRAGADGFIFYPAHSLSDIPHLFDTFALPPPMPWKSDTVPISPSVKGIERRGSADTSSYIITVSLPETGANPGGNAVKWINLYTQPQGGSPTLFLPHLSLSYLTEEKKHFVLEIQGLGSGDDLMLTVSDYYGTESPFSKPVRIP